MSSLGVCSVFLLKWMLNGYEVQHVSLLISMDLVLSTASDGEELKVIDRVKVLRNDNREGKNLTIMPVRC